jgi:prevent-host-death family protein
MVYYLTIMIKLNIHEAKTHLSHYLDEVQKGEKILLCKRNHPIAEIRPIPSRQRDRRPIGLAKGKFHVPDTFFEELPDESVALFDGENP